MSNVVARVYKNTGKFEGIKGIETGPEDHFDELLTPSSLSSDYLTFNVGKYACTLLNSLGDSISWTSNMQGVSTIYFGDYSKLDTITTDYLFSVSTSNFTVNKGPSWDDSSINGFDLIYTSSPGTNCTEIYVLSSDDGCSFVSEDAQIFSSMTSMSLPYDTRITKHSHSISRQGVCTFSEIVESDATVFNIKGFYGEVRNDTSSGIITFSFNNGLEVVITPNSPSSITTGTFILHLANPVSSTWGSAHINCTISSGVITPTGSITYGENNDNSKWKLDAFDLGNTNYETNIFPATVQFKIGVDFYGTVTLTDGNAAGIQSTSSGLLFLPETVLFSSGCAVSKDSGVLTCSEFIEGDYNTTIKYLDGFSGSVFGNKITCNNGYTFELFADSSGSVPITYGNVVTSGSYFVLCGTENSMGGEFDFERGTVNFIGILPNRQKLLIDRIELYISSTSYLYIRITDPEGNSVTYTNSSSNYQGFHPIDTDNQLWIPSKYRYQNYLI